MDLSTSEIRWIIQALIILVLSICVHEFGHAIVADKLGDPLPRSQGRTTLNPLAHADPLGTLLFPLIALVLTHGASLGFGWGRPVLTSPRHYSRRFTMRTGHMLVAAAGPIMNILFGLFITALHAVCLRFGWLSPTHQLSLALSYASLLNFVLAFFNLIPAPPLDGGTVLAGLLPTRWVPGWERIAIYGPFLLLLVIWRPELQSVFVYPAKLIYNAWGGLLGVPQYYS